MARGLNYERARQRDRVRRQDSEAAEIGTLARQVLILPADGIEIASWPRNRHGEHIRVQLNSACSATRSRAIGTKYHHNVPRCRRAANGGALPIPSEPDVGGQALTFTTATQSAAFANGTRYVRLQSDADCHVKFGADPTATTADQPLKAGVEYFRQVRPGHKLSAVTA